MVPLVITGPGVAKRSVAKLAQNVDLAPTFADLAGGSLPKADGRSLVPLLHGKPAAKWRLAALVEHHGPNNDPADPDAPGRAGSNPPTYAAMTTRNTTYVEYAGGSREYYNNRADPQQLRNIYRYLSKSHRAALSAKLAKLTGCHGTVECQVRGLGGWGPCAGPDSRTRCGCAVRDRCAASSVGGLCQHVALEKESQ